MSLEGGGWGGQLLEKCQECPWWGRDLVCLNLQLFKTGVLGRTKPTRFPRNPLHEICALGHKTGRSRVARPTHTHFCGLFTRYVAKLPGMWGPETVPWRCKGKCVRLLRGSAEGGPTAPGLTGLQSANVISAWKSHDLLLKGYDKPASWKIALRVLCKGIKWGTRLLPRVKLCLIKKWKSPTLPQRPRRGRIMLWHK